MIHCAVLTSLTNTNAITQLYLSIITPLMFKSIDMLPCMKQNQLSTSSMQALFNFKTKFYEDKCNSLGVNFRLFFFSNRSPNLQKSRTLYFLVKCNRHCSILMHFSMHRSNYIGRTSTERKQQKLYNSEEERQQIDIVAKKNRVNQTVLNIRTAKLQMVRGGDATDFLKTEICCNKLPNWSAV